MKILPVKRDFQVDPIHRQVKASKVPNFFHRLRATWQASCAGPITFAEFDASIQGWIGKLAGRLVAIYWTRRGDAVANHFHEESQCARTTLL